MPLVPYDRARAWSATTEWWQTAGLGAFEGGGVPNLITNSRSAARCAAALVLARAPETGPVWVWEAGSGNGRWVDQLLAALSEDFGDTGRALLGRLKVLYTELSESVVREVAGLARMQRRLGEGRVSAAVWDITSGEPPRVVIGDGPGEPIAVFATYLACVIPPKQLRKTPAGWFQLYALEEEDGTPAPGFLGTCQWEPFDLAQDFADGRHAAVVKRTMEGLQTGTVVYPERFADFMDWLRTTHPSAMLVVNDVGACDDHLMRSSKDRMPQTYEGSMAHSVDFPWFDAWSEVYGGSVLRTGNPLRQVQTAVIVPDDPPPSRLSDAFTRFVARNSSLDDLADFTEAAYAALQGREVRVATRFYERCHQLDPDNPEFILNVAQLCMAQAHWDRSRAWMTLGKQRDRDGAIDWDAQLEELARRKM